MTPRLPRPTVALSLPFLGIAATLNLASQARAVAPPPSVVRQAAVADAIAPSVVRVEYRLKQDRGEYPGWLGFQVGADSGVSGDSGESLIAEERPYEVPGYLIAPDLVLALDPEVPQRFIRSVSVRRGDEVAEATPVAWAQKDAGVFLKLAAPLAGGTPLTFAASAPEDATLMAVSWAPGDGDWSLVVRDAATVLDLEAPDGARRTRIHREPNQLLVGADGAVHGAYLIGRCELDDSRAADPGAWERLDAAAMQAMLAQAKARADAAILHVSLLFRSPRATPGSQMMFEREATIGTELEALGALLEDGTLLVLAELDPKATARLERIVVRDASGTEHEATFVASLRDWGAIVAKAPESLSGGLSLDGGDVVDLRDRLLPAAEVRMVGRTRLSDPKHVRLRHFRPAFRNIQFPVGVSDLESTFVFLPEGPLAAVPLAVREAPGESRRWSQVDTQLCGTALVARLLADLDASSDAQNVPLSEDDESRTAWLGVMLQPLDGEVARANGVAEFTRDGQFGGFVTYVYPGSPAAEAGIEPGAILLALRSPRRQKPIEIAVSPRDLGYRDVFPWDRLDELPEDWWDQLPGPWPPIEDTLAKTLTELGLGSTYTLEYFQDGQKASKELVVTQSPPHYGNAPKFESSALGATVRDLTLEVRQYLQLAPDADGVVVVKLEPGQRAGIAGLRPLEIITEVDGEPVKDAASFGAMIEGKKDLKLTVNRAGRERVLRVVLDG